MGETRHLRRGPAVLFLSADRRESDASRLYRCEYPARQIERAGGRARVAHVGRCEERQIRAADVVVLSRCRWSDAALGAVRTARRLGKLVCGDLDDRIYSPWQVDETGAMRSREPRERDLAAERHAQLGEREVLHLLPSFDQVLVSTPAIREELEELGIAAHVSRNLIDTDARPPLLRVRERLRRILFMTGTRTHNADFEVARAGLARFLRRQPDVQLSLLGPLDAPRELTRLPQVQLVDKLPVEQLAGFVAEHDVCLVPLEATRFNDCKSALKFIEAGLVSVPVIASPRREFVAAIRAGDNGLLAEGDAGWYEALCALYDSPELLRKLASGARRSVLAEHSVASAGACLAEHFAALLERAAPMRAPVRAPVPGRAWQRRLLS